MAEESQIRLRLTPSDSGLDAAELESMAIQLRQDLLDAGVVCVEREPDGPAPAGARSVELIAAGISFLVSSASVLASAAQVADFLQRWRQAHPRRARLNISVDGAGVAAARTGRRSALLVANAAYADPALSRLRSPIQDTRALAGVLGEPGIGGFAVDQLVDAGEATLRRRVAAFFAYRDPDDVLLMHFSCHGLKDHRGRLYLAAADTELGSVAATALPASFVAEQMSESASRRVLLILDCCYSGAFARGTSVRADRTVHIAEEFGGGTGRTVLTASSATEYSFEGDQLTAEEARPSVFTEALVTGLRTGAADLDSDGEISADELYEYAHRLVRDAGTGQEPRKWTFGMAGALVVARSTRPAALPEEIRADLTSERPVLRLEAVAALAALVAGTRPGLRAAARAALDDLREHDDSVRVREAAEAALAGSASTPTVPRQRAVPPEPVAAPPAMRPASVPAPAPARAVPPPPTPAEAAPPAAVSMPVPAKAVPKARRRVVYAALTAMVVLVATAVTWVVAQHPGKDGTAQVGFGGSLGHSVLSDTETVTYAALAPDHEMAYTVSQQPGGSLASDTLHLWNVASGEDIGTFTTDSGWEISPDGKTLATVIYTGKRRLASDGQTIDSIGAGDTQVKLWNIATGKATATFSGFKGSAVIAFSPDGEYVATASTLVGRDDFDNPVRLWDPATGHLLVTYKGHTNGVQSMMFNNGGTLIATGSVDHTARLWSLSTGKSTATLGGNDMYVYNVRFSPDGKILATWAGGDSVRLWNVATGKLVVALATKAAAVFSPDGKHLATLDADKTVRLWDTKTGESTAAFTGHTDTVNCAAFSPDGTILATAGADKTVRLWNASTGAALAVLTGHTAAVTDVEFSPDGKTLTTVGLDKTVWRWNTAR